MATQRVQGSVVNIQADSPNTTIVVIYGETPVLNATATTGNIKQNGFTDVTINYVNYTSDTLAGNFTSTDSSKLYINWGDGNIFDQRFIDGPWTVTHEYTVPGQYTITAYMQDPKGNASAEQTFSVNIPAPPTPTGDDVYYCNDPNASNYLNGYATIDDLRDSVNENDTLVPDDGTQAGTICQYTTPTWKSCVTGQEVEGSPPTDWSFVSDGQGGFCWDPVGAVSIQHKKTGQSDDNLKSLSERLLFQLQRGTSDTGGVGEFKISNSGTSVIYRSVTFRSTTLFKFRERGGTYSASANQFTITVGPGEEKWVQVGLNINLLSNVGDGTTDFNLVIEVEDQ